MAALARWLRTSGKVLLWTLLGLVVVVALALGTVHTDWGRGLVRDQATGVLDDVLVGGADIGRIEGSLLGRFTIYDVVIRDAQGRAAVTVDALTVDTSLAELASGAVVVNEVELVGPKVVGHRDADGTLNLATLVAPTPPTPDDGEPSTLQVDVDKIAVSGGSLRLHEPDGRVLRADDLALSARLALRGAAHGVDIDAALLSLSAHIDPDLPESEALAGRRESGTDWPSLKEADVESLADASADAVADALSEAAVPSAADVAGPDAAAVAARRDGFPLQAKAQVSVGTAAVARELEISIGGTSIVIPFARYGLDDGSLVASADVHAAAVDIAAVAPSAGVLTDFDLSLWAQRAGDELPIAAQLVLDSAGGQAQVSATVVPELPDAQLVISATDLNLARIIRDALPTELSLALTATARGDSLQVLVADANLDASGVIDGLRVPGVAAKLSVSDQRAELDADLDVPAGRVNARGAVALDGDEPVLEQARVRGRVSDLARLAAAVPALRAAGLSPRTIAGATEFDVRASGRFDALAVAGQLSATELVYLDSRVDDVAAEFDLSGIPSRMRGSAAVKAAGVVQAGAVVGDVSLDVTSMAPSNPGALGDLQVAVAVAGREAILPLSIAAQVSQTGERVDVALGDYRFSTGQLLWRGHGGAIALGGRGGVRVRGVALRSPAGRIGVDGSVAAVGNRADAEVALRDLDLAQLREALMAVSGEPIAEVYGVASGTARVQARGRAITGDVEVGVDGLALTADAPRLDVSADVALERAALTLDARASGAEIGAVTITAVATPPADVTNAVAWSRLDEGALERLEVALQQVKLAGVKAWAPAGLEAVSGGTVDGSFAIEGGARGASGRLEVKTLRTPELIEPVDAEVQIDMIDRDLRVTTALDTGGRGSANLVAEATLPAKLADPASWAEIDQRALRGVTLSLATLDADYWAGLAGVELALGAQVGFDVELGEGLAETKLRGQLTLPTGAVAGLPPVTADVSATVGASEITGQLEVALATERYLTAEMRLEVGADDILQNNAAGFAGAAASAKWKLTGLPMALIGQLSATEARLAGTLHGDGEVTGTMLAPEVDADLRTAGFKVDDIEIPTLTAKAKYRGDEVTLALDSRQAEGGTIDVDATLELVAAEVVTEAAGAAGAAAGAGGSAAGADGGDDSAGPSPRVALQAQVRNYDIGLADAFVPDLGLAGRLDADLEVTGDVAAPLVAGTVKLRDGVVRPGAPLGRVDQIEVDVTVDEREAEVRVGARAGRGRIDVTGTAGLREGAPQTLAVDIETRRVPLDFGAAIVSLNSDTRIQGELLDETRGWEVDVRLNNVLAELPKASGRELHATGDLEDVVFMDGQCRAAEDDGECAAYLAQRLAIQQEEADGVIAEALPPFRIAIRAPDTIRVRGVEVNVSFGADLVANSRSGELLLTGSVAANSGFVDIVGRRYEVRQAVASFDVTPDGVPNPGLDVVLAHEFSALTLYIQVQGTAAKPELLLRSDPGIYGEDELLAFVLGATPGEESSGESDSDLGTQATGVAAGMLAGKVQSLVEDVLPVDVLKVEIGDEGQSAQSLTVGKWLTENLFLSYSQRFEAASADENNSEVAIEYRFWKRWLLEGFYGDNSVGGLDMLWIRRF